MTSPKIHFAERNGWKLLRTSAFSETITGLQNDVARLRDEDPTGYILHPKAKLLKRILDLMLDEIPRDPNANAFGLGNTLGPAHRHWRRAKFLQRFRLFYRFDSTSRIIIYAWVNDENTLRKAGSRTDPYSVFLRRLSNGNPPDDWEELLTDARQNEARPEG